MAQSEFSIHLGGGLYMDSNGVLSSGTDPDKPVYATPGGGFPVNMDAVAKAFQGVAKALPNKDDPKSREKFDKILDGIGMLAEHKENLIAVLQSVGAVASVIGSVVPVVGAVLAVLTALLGLFKQGPSALELMITRRFDDLERTVRAIEKQIQLRDLRNQRNIISNALAALSNFITELKNTPPNEAQLLLRRQDMRTQVQNSGIAVRNLLDTSTWLTTFDSGEHEAVWFWLQHRLLTFPTNAPPVKALFPAQGANVFDHRLMVPLVMFGVTGFLTVLRSASPEFRSTRENREDLWDFAPALEVLAENMRREGLARTVYTAADFQDGPGGGIPWGLSPAEVIDLSLLGMSPYLAPGSTRFPVGALDLRSHDDAYFTPGFSAGSIQHAGPQYGKQGILNLRWMPPAKLEAYDVPVQPLGWEPANQPPQTERRYRITNPDECAKAANAQAEQDYVDLLYSSGYFNLIHLIATLRNEATDPDRSQTVRSEAWLQRKPGTSVATTVESEPILFTGVISSPAERQPHEYKATTWFTTQPLGRDRSLHYRVWLRTLSMGTKLPSIWNAAEQYSYFHQLGYSNDPAHPGFKMLVTSTGTALAELKTAEGTSQAEKREYGSTIELEASTFDWWIPVNPLAGAAITPASGFSTASLRATGWEAGEAEQALPILPAAGGGVSPPPGPTSGVVDFTTVGLDFTLSDFIGWQDSKDPVNGHRRLVKKEKVKFEYTLRWVADRLTVTLRNNRPADRNYIVYVVVEETLGSGAVLHTVEPVPVIGQLTFVPQEFFDREAEARAKVNNLFREFERRFAKSLQIQRPRGVRGPGPGWLGIDPQVLASDPVLRQFQLGDFTNEQDLQKLAAVIGRDPAAARILQEVLSEADVPQQTMLSLFGPAPSQSGKSD